MPMRALHHRQMNHHHASIENTEMWLDSDWWLFQVLAEVSFGKTLLHSKVGIFWTKHFNFQHVITYLTATRILSSWEFQFIAYLAILFGFRPGWYYISFTCSIGKFR
jgi:hypothetical protein